jgi:hypothetical protein
MLLALTGCTSKPAPSPRDVAAPKPPSPQTRKALACKTCTREQTVGILGAGLFGACTAPLNLASYAVLSQDNTGLDNLWPVRHGEMLAEPVAVRFDRRRAAAILGTGLLGAGASLLQAVSYAAFVEDAAALLELRGSSANRLRSSATRARHHRYHPLVIHVPYTSRYATANAPATRPKKPGTQPATKTSPKPARPARPPRPRR